MQQCLLQLLQKGGILAFNTGQKHGVLQIMAVGHIRGLFVLRLCRVVVHQQLPFPLHTDTEPQPGQPGQRFALVPPQPQSCRQQTDHAALGGFPARLAGLKFRVRAPRLQRRCQPKQQRCHYPTSFPASASRTAFSSASSIAFAVCAGASISSPLPTVKLCAGASAKLLYICCAYCASAALEGAA